MTRTPPAFANPFPDRPLPPRWLMATPLHHADPAPAVSPPPVIVASAPPVATPALAMGSRSSTIRERRAGRAPGITAWGVPAWE